MKKLRRIRNLVNEISWWENKLTSQERSELMGDYMWTGTIEERHAKLHEMYLKWESDNAPKTMEKGSPGVGDEKTELQE